MGDAPIHDPTTDRRHWKAGVFYWNPNDARDVVPRRRGYGTTLNFAQGRSWLALVLLLVGPAIAIASVLWAQRH